MSDIGKMLQELANETKNEKFTAVDVTEQVMTSLANYSQSSRTELLPLLFASGAMLSALALGLAFCSDWQAVVEPWAFLAQN